MIQEASTIQFARKVGKAVGRIRMRIAPPGKCLAVGRRRASSMANGATEDQMNTTLQVPGRIDHVGTKVEDLAGTGVHDSKGG